MITGRTNLNQSAWSKIPSSAPPAPPSHGSDRVTLGSTHTPEKKKSDFWGWLDKVTNGINSFTAELQKTTGDPNQMWLYDNWNTNNSSNCKPHSPTPPPAYCPKGH